MHYLIDGYNLLFRIPSEQKLSLKKRREALIEFLGDELRGIKGTLSIIFDSSEQIRDFPQVALSKNLEVIYAPKGRTADEYIIEMVEVSKNPKVLTVVSSDNGLSGQCRHLGAQTQSIEEFLAFAEKKQGRSTSSKPNYRETSSHIERLRKIFEEKLEKE
ncbi:MAG: hypothetical protein KR126chlam1_00493 [Chlamydiae bacterium]|nr:hypothetical protein [Chlamydiota bacterium]